MYKKEELFKKIVLILKNQKLNIPDAKVCANALINAELVGAPSHGVSRLKMYCDRIKKKLINPNPKIKIKRISKSISSVDAKNSIGFVSASVATKEVIKNAKASGIGIVGVKNSGHYGLSGYYIEKIVKNNLIGLCFTNAPPAIAPYGSKKSLFGTNPICFGAPTHKKIPFIFDASMSLINRGKIRVAAKNKRKIPYGVAMDKFGKITTDPNKALKGVQLPISDFRGSGLAWIVDILSGVFTGSAHSGDVKDPFEDFSAPQNVGHLFIAIRPNLFVNNFTERLNKSIKIVKNLPKLKDTKEIMYPGQNKYQRLKLNSRRNIKLSKKVNYELKKLLNE